MSALRYSIPEWNSGALAQKPWFSSIRDDKTMDLSPEQSFWGGTNSLTQFGVTEMWDKLLDRFLKKLEPRYIPLPKADPGFPELKGPCWLWKGQTHPKGYGRLYLGFVDGVKVVMYSHRISFEHFVAIPPEGYVVDHECNHKLCCNPSHLSPVKNIENMRLANERNPYKRRNQYSQE